MQKFLTKYFVTLCVRFATQNRLQNHIFSKILGEKYLIFISFDKCVSILQSDIIHFNRFWTIEREEIKCTWASDLGIVNRNKVLHT